MIPGNSIRPEDFATPEQIERNIERLKKIGDRGRTGNLLADWDAEERKRIAAERAEYLRRRDAEFDLRHPAEPEPAAEERQAPPTAPQMAFDFHARGDDLPLFAA